MNTINTPAPSEVITGDSIRVVTTHNCNERCFFCHNEGTDGYEGVPIDIDTTVNFAIKTRDQFGLDVVHLTGGEPTLHPDLINLIGRLKENDFTVQLTTNGDWAPELLDSLVEAGVDSLNFSIHAITPEDFWAIQGIGAKRHGSLEWAKNMMSRKLSNIESARQKLPVKINTVAISPEITGAVIDFAIEQSIPIRLMRNLNNIEASERMLQKLLSDRGFTPAIEQIADGDSGGSGSVYTRPDLEGMSIKIKRFGDIYLDSMCSGCELYGKPGCREKFYGIRLERDPKTMEHNVRLCIDRDDPNTVIPVSSFFESAHIESIKNNYHTDNE